MQCHLHLVLRCGVLGPGFDDEFVDGVRSGVHGLLEKAVKEQSAASGATPVEAEGELVEVVVEIGVRDTALKGAFEPSLEQRRDPMHAWESNVSRFG